jgi:hypothetical protein
MSLLPTSRRGRLFTMAIVRSVFGKTRQATMSSPTNFDEERMLREATMRRTANGQGHAMVLTPTIYVYPDGTVWLYADGDLSKARLALNPGNAGSGATQALAPLYNLMQLAQEQAKQHADTV